MIEYIITLQRKTRTIFRDRWVWKMAWRDARNNVSRLALFAASLVTGIAAVVAIGSLNWSLQRDLDRNAKELVGADIVVNSNHKLDAEIQAVLDSAKVPLAGDTDMASMVMFMNTRQSRLIKLNAIAGAFPFYGRLETKPANAYALMKTGAYAMLDESLATQYEVSSNDSVKIGTRVFRVAGVVTRIPGGGGLAATLAPSVYIAMTALDSTGLVQFGSRVSYSTYIKTSSEKHTELLIRKIQPLVRKLGYSFDTVERRKEGLGRGFQSIYQFFSLLAFVALILGCIGVVSSVHIYAREKREEVAILRCVGSSGWQAFNIYFIQIFVLGILGSLAGVALGVVLQQLVPFVFKDFVPVELQMGISWEAVLEGLILGCAISVLFTILPLVSIRFVPPLTVLRADVAAKRTFSKTKAIAIAAVIVFPIVTAWYQTHSLMTGLFFAGGLGVALGFLALVASFLLFLVRRFFPKGAGFIFRHALSNLFRPNNQTRTLMVSIGLGAFILATLNIIESSLLHQVEFTGGSNKSNTILFDIQPAQKEGIITLLAEHKLPVQQLVPMITCRLSQLKGKSVEAIQKDTTDKIPNWALTREYRVTYRDSLQGSEELTKGKLQALHAHQKDSVGVTISEGMQETLALGIGDSLEFDVQGVRVKAHISGIRKVDWPKDPPNFIFVFPRGVLEKAPQAWVATTRVNDPVQANRFQQDLVTRFPNVSLIDLRLLLRTINDLFNKIGLVIRFLALFSLVTGLVVLAAAVLNSKFVRIRENVLLRTLGARTRQLTRITLIEYAYLGLFSALTGLLLSLTSGWLLTKFFFTIEFAFRAPELLIIGGSVVFLTVLIGWWNSREVFTTPPLQVLRKER
jgi:putative ABC transport system permease protein